MSILLALGVRAWQDSRNVLNLVEGSLQTFRSEVNRNRSRMDDLYLYHLGLQRLLGGIDTSSAESIDYMRDILDSLQPTVLLASAWDTALATGALAEIDYDTVFVLSLTYSYQQRFQALYDARLDDVLALRADDNVSSRSLSNTANRYIMELTTAEGDLLAAYDQTISILREDVDEIDVGAAETENLP